MPFDETPSRGPRPSPRQPIHRFDSEISDICTQCGLTYDAWKAYPETPCDVTAALMANVERVRQRDKFEAARAARRKNIKYSRGGNLDGNGDDRR